MISERFPLNSTLKVAGQELRPEKVLSLLADVLTPERQARISNTVDGRTCNVVSVLENIYDRGNVSAVLRSAEAMGFQCAHVIEVGEKFKSANRVTQGADKWLEIQKWKNTPDCVRHLKQKGFQVLATHLDQKARPIGEFDFSIPTAVVFGNEKDGISREMIDLADHTMIIPMQGFVQSFNISVAAAICFYHVYLQRMKLWGKSGDLSDEEKLILRATFSLRSSDNPDRLIEELLIREGAKV